MPVRTDEEVREALEAQAHDNANAGELLDILRWSSSGNAAQKRARLLSFLDGPASRRRAGWLDLLLQVHAAGATSFNDLEPDELEIDDEDRGGDDDARLPVGSVSVLLDLVDRLRFPPGVCLMLCSIGSGDILASHVCTPFSTLGGQGSASRTCIQVVFHDPKAARLLLWSGGRYCG